MQSRWNGTLDSRVADDSDVPSADVDFSTLAAIEAEDSNEPPDTVVVDATALCTTAIARRVALDADVIAEDHTEWLTQMCMADTRNICDKYPSAQVIWVFDSRSNRDYRNTILNGYKHGRVAQFDSEVRKVVLTQVEQRLRDARATVVTIARWEADDAMADIVRYHIQACRKVLLVSRDSDLSQLRYEPSAHKYLRFYPPRDTSAPCGTVEYWWTVKASMGDVSDNVPGLHGIGEKQATQGASVKRLESAATVERVGTGLDSTTVTQRVVDRNVRCVIL